MCQRARTLIARCCTQKRNSPVVVVDVTDWHTTEAADMSKTRGTTKGPTSMDPPRVGGVNVVLEAGKTEPLIVGIVAGRVIGKASVEKES